MYWIYSEDSIRYGTWCLEFGDASLGTKRKGPSPVLNGVFPPNPCFILIFPI